MAIYHLSVKTISRSAGRSATAAAAYRAGVQITDERTGDLHDYSRRGGVESAELVLPVGAPSWASDRSALWNAAEQAEKRKNSTVAREFEIALPVELSPQERRELAVSFARELVERHGCAADVCIHAPGKEGDNRNHHAHVLLTTRRLGPEGLGEKTRELDEAKTGSKLITQWRERFASMQNERLQAAGLSVRVDHRTLADQGIDRIPTVHLGPAAVGYERRTGEVSRKREDFEIEAEAFERLRQAKAAGEQERREIGGTIIDLSRDLDAARSEQARLGRMSLQELEAEISRFRPPPVHELVERDPVVLGLDEEQKRLMEELQKNKNIEQTVIDSAERYRRDFPIWSKAHDLGLYSDKRLDYLEQTRIEAVQKNAELQPRIAEIIQQGKDVRREIEQRITLDQAPAMERLADLSEFRNIKLSQERAEKAKHYARESAGQKFKKWAGLRDIRCAGWGDRGEDWQALPPSLREAIEIYNTTPAEGRAAFLDRFLSPQQIGEFDKLQKEMDRGRGR